MKTSLVNVPKLERWSYAALLVLAGSAGLAGSWTAIGHAIDNHAYDCFFRLYNPPPVRLQSEILGIDEQTLQEFGGVPGIRSALARGLELIAPAKPLVVATDVILAEPNPADDRLERALRNAGRVVLSSDLLASGGWDEPLPRFRALAAGIGQVHAELDRYDAVSRELPLEKVAGRDRRWALALEAFRASRNATILETPDSLEVAGVVIPSSFSTGRAMRIRYVPPERGGIPGYSVAQLVARPELSRHFANKVVFAGVTDQTAVRDRWMTPYSGGISMPGVEMHANAFETIANGLFLRDVPGPAVIAWCAALVAAVGFTYAFLSGSQANGMALLVLLIAFTAPYAVFRRGIVLPWTPGVLCAWFGVMTAAAWKHFLTRRKLRESNASQGRYQRAIQFVTHEMRTPLTAIQGSSELMSRYALPDEKRAQMAQIINSESKRLGKMIETFLDIERLNAGGMDLRREALHPAALVEQCLSRVRPLAENKGISIQVRELPSAEVLGDRELLEYAIYNLLTNAVKYSPAETEITVSGDQQNGHVRLWVQDQGMGFGKDEAKHIFERFYRTKNAERSGTSGSGIGLSLVEQIVHQHAGSVEVESSPGRGSRFTLVLPAGRAVVPATVDNGKH